MSSMSNTPWASYAQSTHNNAPDDLMLYALNRVRSRRHALDLGAGGMANTRFLLGSGFAVTAVDSEPSVQEHAKNLSSALSVCITPFDRFDFTPGKFNFVLAAYSLPYSPSESFSHMFGRLRKSLAPKGVFCGTFFGPHYQTNSNAPQMTLHSPAQIRAMLGSWNVHLLREDMFGSAPFFTRTHHHVIDVVAQAD